MDQHQYGTFANINSRDEGDATTNLDLEQAHRVTTPPLWHEKNATMRPLADQAADTDSVYSQESYDSAQAGVKRLEAISSTWSRTGLFVAYAG